MGYDVHFQLVDCGAVDGMLRSLLEGQPPPPSAFDQRPDAAAIWADARAQVLGADRARAAQAAGALVAVWSAASLPFVWMRNFGVTHHPVRMEDALRGVPSASFGDPAFLLSALPDDLALSGRLDGERGVGGFVLMVEDAAHAMRRFMDALEPGLQARARPLLKLLRAAERSRLAVLETADLLPIESAATHMLAWPGLDRHGLDGGPLSAAEWRAFAAAEPDFADLEDAVDRIERSDLQDAEVRAAIFALLANTDWHARRGFPDPFLPRLLTWLEAAFAQGFTAEAWSAYAACLAAFQNASPVRPLDEAWLLDMVAESTDPGVIADLVMHFGPAYGDANPTPSPALADALLRATCRTGATFEEFELSYYVEHLIEHGASSDALVGLFTVEPTLPGLRRLNDLREQMADYLDYRAAAPGFLSLIERALAEAEPSDALASEAHSLLKATISEIHDEPMTPAFAEQLARTWLALFARSPAHATPLSRYALVDTQATDHILAALLAGAPDAQQVLGVGAILEVTEAWSETPHAWATATVEQHREPLVALLRYAYLEDRSEAGREAARAVLEADALQDPRLAECMDAPDLGRADTILLRVASSQA